MHEYVDDELKYINIRISDFIANSYINYVYFAISAPLMLAITGIANSGISVKIGSNSKLCICLMRLIWVIPHNHACSYRCREIVVCL